VTPDQVHPTLLQRPARSHEPIQWWRNLRREVSRALRDYREPRTAKTSPFFGLPSVEPMQAAVLQNLEKRMLADIERFSPESLIQNWLAVGPPGTEQIRDLFRGIFSPPKTATD
jgi:Family of unknown function (DUF6489)